MQRLTPRIVVLRRYIGGNGGHKAHYSRAADRVENGIYQNVDKRCEHFSAFRTAEPYFLVMNYGVSTAVYVKRSRLLVCELLYYTPVIV